MLESAKDLFFIILALGILWFTVFVCWALYYIIAMLRDFSKMTLSVREKLETVDKILKLVKEKLEKGSNHMAMITDSVIKLAGFFMEKQKSGSGGKKKKK